MRTGYRKAIAASALAATFAGGADASRVELRLEGVITEAPPLPHAFSEANLPIEVGDRWTMVIRYDTADAPTAGDATTALYDFTYVLGVIDSTGFTRTGPLTDTTLAVFDDVSEAGTPQAFDALAIAIDTESFDGDEVFGFDVLIEDPSESAFDSLLPPSALDLADFPITVFRVTTLFAGDDARGIVDTVEIEILCPGDIDRDGAVGSDDLALLLAEWGAAEGAAKSDLDGDGVVGSQDLALLLALWGEC